jgi:hypothetical protein
MMTRKEYVPPEKSVIDQYAKAVCEALADRSDESFAALEVVWGLAEFVRMLADAQADRLTENTK